MGHAYMVAAHHQMQLLRVLLLLIDDERNDIYLHVDKKCKEFDEEEIKASVQKAKLHFLKRRTVTWGGYSQIRLELELLKNATCTYHDVYHLISGVDLPLKTQNEIYSFFSNHKGMQFISYDYQLDMDDITNRMAQYRIFQDIYGNKKNFLFKIDAVSIRLQKLIGINRVKNISGLIRKGANWFSITHEFAKYVLGKEKEIRSRYKFTRCCDEVFLQTILYNSPYSKDTYFDKNANRCYNMRYVDFQRGNPYIFRMDDEEFLENRRELFARKFDYFIDKNIVFSIRDKIIYSNRS